MKILITGPAGSGKTTKARELLKRMNVPFTINLGHCSPPDLKTWPSGAVLFDEIPSVEALALRVALAEKKKFHAVFVWQGKVNELPKHLKQRFSQVINLKTTIRSEEKAIKS